MRRVLIFPCCLILQAALADVATNPEHYANKTFPLVRLTQEQKPTIDGKLENEIWSALTAVGELHQVQPNEFAAASQPTDFWVAYDEDFLYIAAQAYADPESIVARQHIQGRTFDSDDQIHFSLDPFHQGRNGYFFQTNPNGIRNEALATNRSSGFNAEWKTLWQVEAQINPQGWAMEAKIPFESLDFDPRNPDWGFNFGRVIRETGEILAWSSYGNDVWEMGPAAMGNIQGIENIERSSGLEIQVSGIGNRSVQRNQDDENELEPSMDIFYKPNPKLTIAATINTDFSATEVDDRIVNLTRFNILLPEKRDFFLQDANRFTFAERSGNAQPFFSRKIGLDEEGNAIDLLGGLKISGQQNGFSFGGLALRQKANAVQENDADLLVLRASQAVFKESSIGVVTTQGNPLSDDKNGLVGIDFVYNNSSAFWDSQIQAALWYQKTHEQNNQENSEAYGVTLGWPNATWKVIYHYLDIGENFNPAMGFLNRLGIKQHDFELGYTHFNGAAWLQSVNPGLSYSQVDNQSGMKESERLELQYAKFSSRVGDSLSVSSIHQYDVLAENFAILPELNIQVGEYEFDRFALDIQSATARPFYARLKFETGDFFDGKREDVEVGMGYRPIDRYLMSLDVIHSELDLMSGVGEAKIVRFSHEWAITPAWAWMLSTQYDNVSRLAGMNSRFRWMPSADREMFIVFNHRAQKIDNNTVQSLSQDQIIKLSYTFRI